MLASYAAHTRLASQKKPVGPTVWGLICSDQHAPIINLLRIAILTSTVARTGGTAAHVLDSAVTLRDSGHEVQVLAQEVPKPDRAAAGFVMVPDLAAMQIPEASEVALHETVRRFAPDVLHVHDLHDMDVVARLRVLAPIVLSMHNYFGCMTGMNYFKSGRQCHRPHGPGCLANIVVRGCDHRRPPRPSIRRYRHASALLDGLRDVDVAAVYSRFAQQHLVSNAINHSQILPLFVEPADEIVPAPGARRILFSGRVVPYKGLEVLVQALSSVDGAFLEIAGDGWGMGHVHRRIARLGLTGRVRCLGWCTPAQLAEATRLADVVAVPSLWPEPFGLVGLEAMRHGRAVVASDTGGISEWLTNGETGILSQPGDTRGLAAALRDVLDDPVRSAEMGRRGAVDVAKRFSPEAYVMAADATFNRAQKSWEHWRSAR